MISEEIAQLLGLRLTHTEGNMPGLVEMLDDMLAQCGSSVPPPPPTFEEVEQYAEEVESALSGLDEALLPGEAPIAFKVHDLGDVVEHGEGINEEDN